MAASARAEAQRARVRAGYKFLVAREVAGSIFTVDELSQATTWKAGTIGSYLTKKWAQLVHKGAHGLRATGVAAYTEDEFVHLMSQNDAVSADPKRPRLPPIVEALVRKARESALLALQLYNSPATVFRTEGFAVLMVIAWTALFHAIFENRGEAYFYVEADGLTPKLVDGDTKAWELETCLQRFWGGGDNPVRRNLKFFVRLRNRVEHRYVPAIDPHVAGECQALLLNLDELLTETFGSYFAIRESLAVPLQTSTVRSAQHGEALRKLQARHFDEVKEFIDAYRSDVPDLMFGDQRFAFSVFMFPKTGNHRTSSDLAVEFVKLDPSNADEIAQLERQIVAVREKQVPVVNAGLFKAKDVVKHVASQLGKAFNRTHHARAWARYEVRKAGKFDASACNTKYCVPDPLHSDFAYSQDWIAFLVTKLTNEVEYAAITSSKTL